MNVYWPVAVITYKEGIRNRALYGITLLALLLLSANLLVSSMIMREVGKVAVDMVLSTVSFAGLLLVLFVGINLLAKDLDRRTIYMVLARPISRVQYVYGKFLGMVLLLLTAEAVLGAICLLSIWMVKLSYPTYFDRFSWGMVLLALLYAFIGLLMLTAISFFFSSLTSTSFVTLVLTLICYISGHAVADVKALVEAPQGIGIEVSGLTQYVVKSAYYLLPNLSFFDIKTHAAHGLSIPLAHVYFTLAYGLVYTGMVLALAALLFQRREFP